MRHMVVPLALLGLVAFSSIAAAQGPFGRVGPGMALRAMMPPIPAPPIAVRPSYVRVPGVAVGPSVYFTPFGPAYAGYRPAVVVAGAVAVPATNYPGRIAVVSPTSSLPSSVARSVAPSAVVAPSRGNAAGDLQPGMVLPDGAIVVSVGPVRDGTPGAGPTAVAKPSLAPSGVVGPNSAPAAAVPGTSSILETEELPVPQPAPAAGSENPTIRQF